jgi:membrane-bound lytic murein transglycosylase D
MKAWRGTVCAGLLAGAGFVRAEEASQAAPVVPAEPTAEQVAELHRVASEWWEQFAPEAVKEEYELIPREEFVALLTRVETAGGGEDLAAYAAYAPETRAAIAALRALPDFADYADWLREQLEDMELAGEAVRGREVAPPPPSEIEKREEGAGVPLYGLWRGRMAGRAAPARAEEFLPVLRAAFAAEGVPEALVWLAETESSFNPRARSPAGARGLFQLMPETARSLGLSLFPFDQRTNPERSARAAAAYLKSLYTRFGDWPLALAAYNAGQGRVSRTLKARGARDFAGIAEHLPAETRLYVPKVLATVNVRAGVTPEELAGAATK